MEQDRNGFSYDAVDVYKQTVTQFIQISKSDAPKEIKELAKTKVSIPRLPKEVPHQMSRGEIIFQVVVSFAKETLLFLSYLST